VGDLGDIMVEVETLAGAEEVILGEAAEASMEEVEEAMPVEVVEALMGEVEISEGVEGVITEEQVEVSTEEVEAFMMIDSHQEAAVEGSLEEAVTFIADQILSFLVEAVASHQIMVVEAIAVEPLPPSQVETLTVDHIIATLVVDSPVDPVEDTDLPADLSLTVEALNVGVWEEEAVVHTVEV